MDGKIEVNNNFYHLTKHALHRANKRKITLEEIIEVLNAPKSIRRSRRNGKDDIYTWLGRNEVVLITNVDKSVVISVFKRNKHYAKARAKSKKNKRQLENKRLYGNRARK